MLKKLALTVVALVVLIGVVGVFALNPLVEKFRPQILSLLSQQLGHKVAFDDLKLSLLPSAGIEVRNIRFEATTNENFSVPRVLLKTSLLGIAQGEMSVSELRVERASLRITKRKDGSFSVGDLSLSKKATPDAPKREDGDEARETKRVSSDGKSVSLNVDEAAFDALNLVFTDESVEPARVLAVENLTGRFSLKKQGDQMAVSGTVDAKESAVRFGELFLKNPSGTLNTTFDLNIAPGNVVTANSLVIHLAESSATAKGTLFPMERAEADIELDGVNLAALADFVPMLKAYEPAGAISGKVFIGDHAPGQPPVAAGGATGPKLFGDFSINGLAGLVKIPPKEGKPEGEIRITGGTGELRLEDDTLVTKGFALTVAGSPFSADVQAKRLSSPVFAFNLTSPSITLDPMMQAIHIEHPLARSGSVTEFRASGAYSTLDKGGKVQVSAKEIKTSRLAISDLALPVSIVDGGVRLEKSTLGIFGGKITAEAELPPPGSTLAKARITGSGVDIQSALSAITGNSPMTGKVESTAISADFATDNLLPTLNGGATLRASNGVVLGVNIFGEVLRSVRGIPGVSDALSAYLPREEQELLASPDTPFDTISLQAAFGGGKIGLNSIVVDHRAYTITGEGAATFSGEADIRLQLKLSQRLVQEILSHQPNVKYLLDRNGRLEIPVVVRKSAGRFTVIPDTDRLLKNAARAGATGVAQRALDKVAPKLGGAGRFLDQLLK